MNAAMRTAPTNALRAISRCGALAAALLAAIVGLTAAQPAHAQGQACAWFADNDVLKRVDSATATGPVVAQVPLLNPKSLAMNADDCGVWAVGPGGLVINRYTANGVLERTLTPQSIDSRLDQVSLLRVDPYDRSIWFADGKYLVHASETGAPLSVTLMNRRLTRMALTLDQGLWTVGNLRLSRVNKSGVVQGEYTLPHVPAPKYIEADSARRALWVAGGTMLARHDTSNLPVTTTPQLLTPQFTVNVGQTVQATALDVNTGRLWVALPNSLVVYEANGQSAGSVSFAAQNLGDPDRLSYDPVTNTLWMGARRGVARFDMAGTLLAVYTSRDGDDAIATPAFRIDPVLRLIAPAADSLITTNSRLIRIEADALCNGAACSAGALTGIGSPALDTIAMLLDGQNQGGANAGFALDPNPNPPASTATAATFTKTQALTEGVHQLQISLTDRFGHSPAPVSARIEVDTIAPAFTSLTVNGQASGAVITASPAIIAGTVNDTQAQIILQSPAQTSAANPQTGGSFNFPVTATLGANSVTLSAVDRAGNAATATASFTFQSILGKLETISCDNLTGYALTTGNLAQSIQVEVLVNGQLFTTITAGDPRTDLGPYNGNHGLTWAIPVAWKDGQGRTLQLRSQGTVLDVNANAGANSGGAATVNGNTVTLTCAPNAQKALYFIEPDHLGTPRNVQNGTQQTVWRWDQAEAFGNNAPNENPSNLGAFVFPLRFPGQYADVETGLFYNYFRDYNPVVGGYWQSDPIGLAGGINTYLYVDGRPLVAADPLGLWSIEFGGFSGFGISVNFGVDAQTGRGFHIWQFGYGLGGGLVFDKNGGLPPGLADRVGCEDPGFVGGIAKIGAVIPGVGIDAISAAAGVGATSRRGYGGFDWGNIGWGTKWGFKLEASGGIQLTHVDPPKRDSRECQCSR